MDKNLSSGFYRQFNCRYKKVYLLDGVGVEQKSWFMKCFTSKNKWNGLLANDFWDKEFSGIDKVPPKICPRLQNYSKLAAP